ncbi:MAG TPA: hypothetical protein VF519_15515 [Mycobacteriales bacterium]|jgi:hypothetical protein
MVLGILHNAFELRYVLGRWAGSFTGAFRATVLGLVTVIAVTRLTGATVTGRRVEVVAGFAVLAAGMAWGARRRPVLAAVGLPLAVATGAWAWTHLDWYFVAVTYLHNLVPFVFLWDWSARALAGRARAAFRAVQGAWLLVVPALLLTGALPVPSPASQHVAFAGPLAGHVATVAPPAWRGPEAARLLAVFAFLQVLHYAFWCAFLPRHALDAPPSPRDVATRAALWTGVAVVAAVFAFAYVASWSSTKMAYTSLASYHAYVEYAVLALVVFRPVGER